MPEIIETAEIRKVDTSVLDVDDTYPGTYGFFVELTRDPGPEWGVEFETAYESAAYPGKPPVLYQGSRVCVFYLPRYASDLPRFLKFLRRVIADTNKAVAMRNSVVPNEDQQKADFLARLREAAHAVLD